MILIPYVLLWSTPIVAYHVVKFKPQILHCRNLLSSFVAVFLQKLLGFKYSVIADPRSVYPEEGAIIKRWRFNSFNYRVWKKIEKWTFKHADACIGLSHYFTDYLSCYNENSYYIPAVVAESKKYDGNIRNNLRKKYKIEQDELVVIYVGSIGLWHDVDLLIRIVEIIASIKCERFKIIALSSSKNLKQKLRNRFKDKCILCDVVPVEAVKHFLFMADIGIVPGTLQDGEEYEILYRTMLASKAEEYLCAGLPIVVNDRIISLKDYVEKNNWGGVYTSKQDNIENACVRIYSSEERERISKEAMEIFGLEVVKEKLFKLYVQLIG